MGAPKRMTRLQTAEVRFTNTTTTVFLTLEMLPQCPQTEPFCELHKYYKNRETVWYNDGSVLVKYNDGTEKFFPPKPTLKDVIENSYIGYFRFHKDGSAEYNSRLGQKYWWGPSENNLFEDEDGVLQDQCRCMYAYPEPDPRCDWCFNLECQC
jgi:hypothetical protein